VAGEINARPVDVWQGCHHGRYVSRIQLRRLYSRHRWAPCRRFYNILGYPSYGPIRDKLGRLALGQHAHLGLVLAFGQCDCFTCWPRP